MTNNATAPAAHTATAADKLAAALDAATAPMSQAALALAAGVGRSTATTWIGQQVTKGLAVRIMHEHGPATFARALPACDVCLSTGEHTADCSEGPAPEADDLALAGAAATRIMDEWAATEATEEDDDEPVREATAADEDSWDAREEWAAEAALDAEADELDAAAAEAAEEVPAEYVAEGDAEEAAVVAQVAAAEAQAMGPAVAPTCHCGGDDNGHVHPAKVEAAAPEAAPRARRTRTSGGSKDGAWEKAAAALGEAGPEGLPVPELWKVLQEAGLALSGAYALVNAKRADGTLTTAAEARVLKDRRYALAAR